MTRSEEIVERAKVPVLFAGAVVGGILPAFSPSWWLGRAAPDLPSDILFVLVSAVLGSFAAGLALVVLGIFAWVIGITVEAG